MQEESELNREVSTDKKNIICYNCERIIDVADIEENMLFKCKQCYSTLIKNDYFRVLRNQFSHDYPQDNALKASYLNQSIEAVSLLKDAMTRIEQYLTNNGLL